MKRLAALFLALLALDAAAVGSGGVNLPVHRDKPHLVLISIDGFRWDYLDRYDTPALDGIAANGVRAERMIPVFPTLTFPNHYSIATGLYPFHHGLIGNRFPSRDRSRFYALSDRAAVQDGSWYRGEPVWVAAEKAGMVTAAYYYVGTEADIGGVPMSYWHRFDDSVPGDERVDQVIEWLSMPADTRPHLVTLYFEDVDQATHRFAPGSPQSVAAIERVDAYLGRLLDGIGETGIADQVYIVVVSDHGQQAIRNRENPFVFGTLVDLDGLTVVDHGASSYIYLPEADRERATGIRDAINREWTHGRAMLREDAPASWRVSAEAGFADVILVAEPGYIALSSLSRPLTVKTTHGWAPETPEMHGIFLAMGPGLPSGKRIGAVNAVDIYPLMMDILGLPMSMPIDGDPVKLPGLLSHR